MIQLLSFVLLLDLECLSLGLHIHRWVFEPPWYSLRVTVFFLNLNSIACLFVVAVISILSCLSPRATNLWRCHLSRSHGVLLCWLWEARGWCFCFTAVVEVTVVQILWIGAGELAQQRRALAAPPEDPDSVLSTHMIPYNPVTPVSGIQWPLPGLPQECVHMVYKYSCRQNTHKYKI